ncbi:hypothetical protein O181_053562 [Austropuccinia psidii MF-1]|uniref:Uncharacterized protein n=1 Tax=Austropuccinia psidii MF-1 TaxID=1389203 RepID=A0A9Q3E549_9BASI|nr:hypothetical protein [Austropuccinia psidii MF-1]
MKVRVVIQAFISYKPSLAPGEISTTMAKSSAMLQINSTSQTHPTLSAKGAFQTPRCLRVALTLAENILISQIPLLEEALPQGDASPIYRQKGGGTVTGPKSQQRNHRTFAQNIGARWTGRSTRRSSNLSRIVDVQVILRPPFFSQRDSNP